MAFTGTLGSASSYLGNVELGFGAVTVSSAFTGLLGSANSYYGNLVFGFGTVSESGTYELSLSVSGVAAFRVGQSYFLTITTAGFSAAAGVISTPWLLSVTIGAIGGVSALPGTGYFATGSVAGVSGTAESISYGVGGAVTAAGVSAAASAVALGFRQTLAGVAAVSPGALLGAVGSVAIAGISGVASPGGVVYFVQQAVEGLAAAGSVPGVGYAKSVSVDGAAAADCVELYLQNELLTIGGVADLEVAHLYFANVVQPIAGMAAFAIVQNLSSVDSVTFSTQTSVHIENIYNILYDTNGVCSIVVAIDVQKLNTEQPTAQGSFAATCSATFGRTVAQTLVLTQAVLYKQPTGLVGDTLAMTQTVLVQAIHPHSVVHTIAFAQDAEACRPGSDTLVMTQSAVCVRVRYLTVAQTLAMTQVVATSSSLARVVSQTLVFNVARQVAAPIIGSSGGGSQTQFRYNQPLVSVSLKPKKCLVILGTPTQTVVLPCPIFGDTQSYTGQVDLKKTMTGDTYTYVKKTATEAVKYSFNLGTYKAIELRSFLLGHSQELITMHNWKGETWYVFLTNNPFEFVHAARWQPSGERVDITLEFEGIRR